MQNVRSVQTLVSFALVGAVTFFFLHCSVCLRVRLAAVVARSCSVLLSGSTPARCARAPLTRSIRHSRSSLQPSPQRASLKALNIKSRVALRP
jgi:hypothetical protein